MFSYVCNMVCCNESVKGIYILVRKINLMRNFLMSDYFLFYCINSCKFGKIQIFGDFALAVIDLCR